MSKKHVVGGKIFSVFTIIICLGLCIGLADLFSTFITTSNTSQNNSNKPTAFTVYAVSMYSSTVKKSALEFSESIKKMNGAGYVYTKDDNFYVLASVYLEKNDASKVKESLEEAKHTPSLLEISLPEIIVGKGYSAEELNCLSNALALFKTTYLALYDISISLDTSISSETQARLEVANLQSEVSKIKSDFEALFNSKLTSSLLKLKLSINSVYTLVQQLIDYNENSNQTFSSKIKYNYIEVLSLLQSLGENAPTI